MTPTSSDSDVPKDARVALEADASADVRGKAPQMVDVAAVEAQLILADRLASVSALAASIAGAIHSPLGYTIANLGFALEELAVVAKDLVRSESDNLEDLASRLSRASSAVQAVADAVQEARGGADRVGHLVRELRMFARCDDGPVGALDVRRVLQSAVNIAYRRINLRVRLVEDYGKTPHVYGNEARLGQAFLNVLVNAAQSVADPDADAPWVRVATSTDDQGQCVVEISDTGRGIGPTHLPRIFEPFFTTRAEGGPGLGLSTCQAVVTSMGGQITVETREGEGTAVRMIIPAASEGSPDVAVMPATSPPPAPRARVLVIDDEPMMVRAIQRLLEGEHEVLLSTDPIDAVAQVREGARFDVILCDLMMPSMSGMELFEAICRVAPDQAKRIVFMTGGAFAPAVQEFLKSVNNRRVEKPLERTTLRATIRAQLKS